MPIAMQAADPQDVRQEEDQPSAPQDAELSDELLDAVAGGGNPPTNTVESTGSAKSM